MRTCSECSSLSLVRKADRTAGRQARNAPKNKIRSSAEYETSSHDKRNDVVQLVRTVEKIFEKPCSAAGLSLLFAQRKLAKVVPPPLSGRAAKEGTAPLPAVRTNKSYVDHSFDNVSAKKNMRSTLWTTNCRGYTERGSQKVHFHRPILPLSRSVGTCKRTFV